MISRLFFSWGPKNALSRIFDIAIFVGKICPYNVGNNLPTLHTHTCTHAHTHTHTHRHTYLRLACSHLHFSLHCACRCFKGWLGDWIIFREAEMNLGCHSNQEVPVVSCYFTLCLNCHFKGLVLMVFFHKQKLY